MELALLNRDKAEYAKSVLSAVKGVKVLSAAPTFNEFTVSLPANADVIVEKLIEKGIAAGVPLGQYYQGAENFLVVTVTEKRTRGDIDRLAEELGRVLCS